MAIGPMDIHHKEFSTVRMGGYNKEEVDSFLDMVADELDRLLHRNQEQAELVEGMRQKASQYDNMQQTLQNALINAQKSADNIVQEARKQAEAQIKDAQEQGNRIIEGATTEKGRISQAYSGIRDQVFRYMATIRELMDKNQAILNDYETRLASMELKEEVPPPAPEPLAAEPEFTAAPSQTEIPPQAAAMEEVAEEPAAAAPPMDFQPEPVEVEAPPPKPQQQKISSRNRRRYPG